MSNLPVNSRPKFTPSLYNPQEPCGPLVSRKTWTPLLFCPADFPLELFETAISQLIHHPEYNSTLILRSETVAEITHDFPASVPVFDGLCPLRNVHRKLLPRRPGRDSGLEQHCTMYSSDDTEHDVVSTLVLTPIFSDGYLLPYYHPAVSHLAFRYLQTDPPILRIEVIPLPGTPTDPNSRLYRTCLALLETLHRYGWGAMTNYQKRVQHDCIVPREAYQDLYLIMRERHKYIVGEWQESTDPLKHVFEDIGIATFLILLWKDMYHSPSLNDHSADDPPWKSWPHPPGGFLDLGCGNGLLTHILCAEGYTGKGIDLRARISWAHYPQSTRDHLHVHALDPTSSDMHFSPGAFLIGNHADELTPWVPVLATLRHMSGFLSIPCCAWAFDARFERGRTPGYGLSKEDADALNLGGNEGSSYAAYRAWLAGLSVHCGWKVETETLRIPSTRNWAIIGRTRVPNEDEALQHAQEVVDGVRVRGVFKTRKPEGKAGDH